MIVYQTSKISAPHLDPWLWKFRHHRLRAYLITGLFCLLSVLGGQAGAEPASLSYTNYFNHQELQDAHPQTGGPLYHDARHTLNTMAALRADLQGHGHGLPVFPAPPAAGQGLRQRQAQGGHQRPAPRQPVEVISPLATEPWMWQGAGPGETREEEDDETAAEL